MKRTKVYIAIPTGGSIRPEILLFVMSIKKYKIKVDITTHGLVVENRNRLIERFLKTDYDWLLFLDGDTIPPNDVLDMTENNLPVCSGAYYVWTDDGFFPLILKVKKHGYTLVDKIGKKVKSHLVEADAVGAGTLLIHRLVFNKIERPYFLEEFGKDGFRKIGHDLYFCRKVKEAGLKIFVDLRYYSKHFKTIDLKEINDFLFKKEGGINAKSDKRSNIHGL